MFSNIVGLTVFRKEKLLLRSRIFSALRNARTFCAPLRSVTGTVPLDVLGKQDARVPPNDARENFLTPDQRQRAKVAALVHEAIEARKIPAHRGGATGRKTSPTVAVEHDYFTVKDRFAIERARDSRKRRKDSDRGSLRC